MKARVIVMPKQAVLDPQGNAVRDAIHHLDLQAVSAVRVGRYFEIDFSEAGAGADASADDHAKLEAKLHALCRDLLSNPVIEDYQLQYPA